MATISVALIFKNEASHLPAWLRSVEAFADEIVAVDCGSTDNGPELLRRAGAKVIGREWTGYGDQRNYAAGFCFGDWILCLDADELVEPGLAAALNQLKTAPPGPVAAYELESKVFFFGRFLRHGGFFPERKLRLHLKDRASWVQNQVHERLEVDGPVGLLRGGYMHHHSYPSVGSYLRRMELYSRQAALQMHTKGKTTSALGAWGHAWWTFMHRYLLRAGFMDGFEGYLAARLESLYVLSKYARLRELNRKEALR